MIGYAPFLQQVPLRSLGQIAQEGFGQVQDPCVDELKDLESAKRLANFYEGQVAYWAESARHWLLVNDVESYQRSMRELETRRAQLEDRDRKVAEERQRYLDCQADQQRRRLEELERDLAPAEPAPAAPPAEPSPSPSTVDTPEAIWGPLVALAAVGVGTWWFGMRNG